MVKYIYIILTLFCITAFTRNEEPCIKFEKKEYNFGLLKAPWEKTAIFKFKNNSSDSVKIKDSHVHCGCTSVKIPNHYILSGKTDSVIVKFLPQKWLNGDAEKDVTLYTTCPTDSVIILTIKAEVQIY